MISRCLFWQLNKKLFNSSSFFFFFLCFLFITDRAGSISTLDSLDFARYSDDGNRETDERVAGKSLKTDLDVFDIPEIMK